MAGGRAVETLPLLFTENCKTLYTHRMLMCGGDCDAPIPKAAAAVTHVQSQSQKVGSGDDGLGLFVLCFDLSSAERDFW